MTLAPGLYPDYSIDAYHADPCVVPSLNQTTAKVLLSRSPAHAREQHPRLSPSWEPDAAKKFDIGNVAHRLLIGRGRDVHVCDFDDWRTKAAKEAREEAVSAGLLPILAHQHETASEMVEAARDQLGASDEYFDAFQMGQGEVMAVAECSDRNHTDPMNPLRTGTIWLRTLIDWLVTPVLIYDYKTTDASASPSAVQYRMMDTEWPVQAAMQEFILDIIDPDNAGRRHHRFVCQETSPPYALTVSELPEATMHIGRLKLRRAIDIWSRCMASGKWPAYGPEIVYPEYPPHVVARLMETVQ